MSIGIKYETRALVCRSATNGTALMSAKYFNNRTEPSTLWKDWMKEENKKESNTDLSIVMRLVCLLIYHHYKIVYLLKRQRYRRSAREVCKRHCHSWRCAIAICQFCLKYGRCFIDLLHVRHGDSRRSCSYTSMGRVRTHRWLGVKQPLSFVSKCKECRGDKRMRDRSTFRYHNETSRHTNRWWARKLKRRQR